ncbi:MAG TPA: SDR family oxidoreductase [Ignavibacteria bacterium]|nr:oxidoreductase [Bacteroidota bacterium]HRI84039.1 SDR family oxidoreductase [Ignavibacteria bacterium]HRJ99547.1 SDR family oxidoreductase [Ignavibacteria bacterium]
MKNYLLAGASTGIGKMLASKLSVSGKKVYATYFRNRPEKENEFIEYNYLNVLDENLSFDYLPESIDGMVYCPGSMNLKPFSRIKPEEFVNDFKLHVTGAVKVIQSVLPKLLKAENSSIVLFSTVAVQTGFKYHTQISASKGAVEGFTRALAAELAPKIRVNCIAPSLTDTPLAASLLNSEQKFEANAQRHPLKRIGSSNEIADMAEFLLSEKASWITGQIYHIDGGMSSLRI